MKKKPLIDHRNIKQIELTFPDETREFFTKERCPTCGHGVFVSRDYDVEKNAPLWTVGCNGPGRCHVTNPVSDQRDALQQWRMIKTLIG